MRQGSVIITQASLRDGDALRRPAGRSGGRPNTNNSKLPMCGRVVQVSGSLRLLRTEQGAIPATRRGNRRAQAISLTNVSGRVETR
jgi:hypothetical protein